jgi:hypothetical protein
MLASLPVECVLDDSEDLRHVLSGLEWFLPEVLREVHREWRGEGLDGIYPALAKKVGDGEIEIVGLCCFISDQTLTPLYVRLQLDATQGEVAWLECWLGEDSGNGMRRVPYSDATVHGNMLHVLRRLDSIDWVYHVGYGERQE